MYLAYNEALSRAVTQAAKLSGFELASYARGVRRV